MDVRAINICKQIKTVQIKNINTFLQPKIICNCILFFKVLFLEIMAVIYFGDNVIKNTNIHFKNSKASIM